MNNTPFNEYLEACREIARGAGSLLMEYFKGDYTTSKKADKSPVTDADIEANRYICERLAKLTPDLPIIAEEDDNLPTAREAMFWLVDPLDGTRAFVRHEEEFSVNIGLIKNRRPVMGVLYAPPQDILYYGAQGSGAFRQHGKNKPEKITARVAPKKIVVARSRSHARPEGLQYLKRFDVERIIQMSSSIKFCLVAEGQADMYTRFGRTMEWDTAAGHAIVDAAGGRVETVDGKPFTYGKSGFENPPFIVFGK